MRKPTKRLSELTAAEVEHRRAVRLRWRQKKKLEDPKYFDRHTAKWVKANKDKVQKIQAEFRRRLKLRDPQANARQIKQWREKNRGKSNIIYARWKRKKYKNDVSFNFKQRLSACVRNGVKRQCFKKACRTTDMLGCSLDEFKDYISTKFTEGMTWDNWGRFGWHLDHIVPCAKFDLSKESEQKRCFHFSNYQPLWWLDNLKKGDR